MSESPTVPPPLPPRAASSSSMRTASAESISSPALPARHRVYIGLAPLENPGFLPTAAASIERALWEESRTLHSYVVIAWQNGSGTDLVRYELLIKELNLKSTMTNVSRPHNPNTVSSTTLPNLPPPSSGDFARAWSAAYPADRIIEVGLTTRAPDKVQQFASSWGETHPKYNAFWENCRTFVDEFVKYVVTVKPAMWERPLPGVAKSSASGGVVAGAGKLFNSPLEYIHYIDKQSRADRKRESAAPVPSSFSAVSVSSAAGTIPLGEAASRAESPPLLPPRASACAIADVTSTAAVTDTSATGSAPSGTPTSQIRAEVTSEGRIELAIDTTTAAASAAGKTEHGNPPSGIVTPSSDSAETLAAKEERAHEELLSKEHGERILARSNMVVPRLNVLITIVGSRGDVQPFIAFAKRLMEPSEKAPWGHRVRLATHEMFRKFVTDSGIEFYPLAGDPTELMAYMVKNPGLIPGVSSILAGDIGKKRTMMKQILSSVYRACLDVDPGDPQARPFHADCIVSNPPTFGHIHVAEKLCIPVHVFFTMPWSPTEAFPHPLINISYSNAGPTTTNRLSYGITELMTWEGLGDIINEFRREELGLPSLKVETGPWLAKSLRIPHTYTWSPKLIPKPEDWGEHIDVAGFFLLAGSGEKDYAPPKELSEFFEESRGRPVVYIGFGSIVVDDPDGLTKKLFAAIEKSGVRALVSKGWGGLGGNDLVVPKDVYMIGSCPHDWLFKNVDAVVHHGGAGTTATGLKCGRPTCIIPFFGDQPFWGEMVARIGVGPHPIPFKELDVDKLAEAITFCLKSEVKAAAEALGVEMSKEDGVGAGVHSFHRQLPLEDMVCDVDPSLMARWYAKKANLKLSPSVAAMLVEAGKLDQKDLLPYSSVSWDSEHAPAELLSGILAGAKGLTIGTTKGIGGFFFETYEGVRKATKATSTSGMATEVGKGMAVGFGYTLYSSFKGAGKLMEGMGDGFRNTSALVEGKPATKTPVIRDLTTGVVEGSKSFGMGWWDGVTGFVVAPVKGAMTGGWKGAAKGFGQGTVGLIAKPAAGTIDLLTHSGKGISQGTKTAFRSWKAKHREPSAGRSSHSPSPSPSRESLDSQGDNFPMTALSSDEVLRRYNERLQWGVQATP